MTSRLSHGVPTLFTGCWNSTNRHTPCNWQYSGLDPLWQSGILSMDRMHASNICWPWCCNYWSICGTLWGSEGSEGPLVPFSFRIGTAHIWYRMHIMMWNHTIHLYEKYSGLLWLLSILQILNGDNVTKRPYPLGRVMTELLCRMKILYNWMILGNGWLKITLQWTGQWISLAKSLILSGWFGDNWHISEDWPMWVLLVHSIRNKIIILISSKLNFCNLFLVTQT